MERGRWCDLTSFGVWASLMVFGLPQEDSTSSHEPPSEFRDDSDDQYVLDEVFDSNTELPRKSSSSPSSSLFVPTLSLPVPHTAQQVLEGLKSVHGGAPMSDWAGVAIMLGAASSPLVRPLPYHSSMSSGPLTRSSPDTLNLRSPR